MTNQLPVIDRRTFLKSGVAAPGTAAFGFRRRRTCIALLFRSVPERGTWTSTPDLASPNVLHHPYRDREPGGDRQMKILA